MTAATQPLDPARTPRSTYSAVAITLHWLIALGILTNIGLAWYFGTLSREAAIAPIQLHKSIGITVLLLTLIRIGWRLIHPAPTLPDHMPTWEKWAAQATHFVFYLLMLGLPLSGWAMVSASPLIKVHPTMLYGVIPWPTFPALPTDPDQLHAARKLFGRTHEWLGWIAYATILLHVAAALKHQLIDRDDVLARMIPFLRRKVGAAA
ncbi:MAG TPA: cytochrome b [Caulobacteraceae bacterium]|jgi:cytochrome b561|nr:cytochrome b [Caulobacteraceae bacterium]